MNINNYLPSQKVRQGISIILLIGIAYGVYYLVTHFTNPEPTSEFIDVVLVDETMNPRNPDYFKDSDGDGAYDWEEALWPELDPNNPDSDGDGISDGRYIKAKRAIQDRERGIENNFQQNLTETQKLGRGALSALLAVANSGQEITPETEAQISQNMTTYIQDLTFGEKIYLRDEFQLVEDSKENSYAYRDAMKELFRTYPVSIRDIELIVEATQSAQESAGRLRTISRKYNNYLGELTTLEVPFLIAGRHTELVNNISQIGGASDNLLQEETDELVTLATIIQLENIMNETAAAIININTYFDIIADGSVFE
jgi:hypothetical protein